MDTIFALATARGKAGIAIVRVSGCLAFSALVSLSAGATRDRKTQLCTLRDSAGNVLDQAFVVTFGGPASFTGEDVVELHLHGSMAIVSGVLRELGAMDGLRLAEPGEFTRRALENGKLDLVQVEGLSDLIDAETEAQRRLAQRVFQGELGQLVEVWRGRLIRAAALIEATIDFADEEVPVDVTPEVEALLQSVLADLSRQLQGSHAAERIRDGFEVAIVGRPNVGKSTLLNALAGRQAAITSDVAGTTRDVIEVRMDLNGLPVIVLDTAGVREAKDKVEQLGVDLARRRAEGADLRVFLIEPGEKAVMPAQAGDVVVTAKVDLHPDVPDGISGLTGAGIDALVDRVTSELESRASGAGIVIRERQRVAIERAVEEGSLGLNVLQRGPGSYDVAAEHMRSAVRALEILVGRIDVENLLDEIFSRFCIGK